VEKRVTVIVLSYNRPRMLAEALDSIRGADEVIVLDDGSDFDVTDVAKFFLGRFPKITWHRSPKLTVEERLITPRVGKLINHAIRAATGDAIAYLCDDDLFHSEWIENIRKYLLEVPAKPHVMYAQWNSFNDGEKPGNRIHNLVPFEMTTGNFAHRRDCSFVCDLWWNEKSVACHDSHFIFWLQDKHPKGQGPKPPGVVAGWRREHPYNLAQCTLGQAYTAKAREVLQRGFLE
jgi:glycosyltransferase involved in cell wall biosynthesis